jgi:DNA-binding LytR/AlgR family response regulator
MIEPVVATALVAEDEPLLAEALHRELARLWPELRIVATVGDGSAAAEQALALRPQLLFLDIRMPGLSGLEAAETIAEEWPENEPLPLIVFVTAYDRYAVQAFERAAVDYLLKPVDPARLAQTCERAQAALRSRAGAGKPGAAAGAASSDELPSDEVLERLRRLLVGAPARPRLEVIQAGVGQAIHLVPVAEVLYFEAADKYVRVVTATREHLIRVPLRELLPQLDDARFWQIHRGTVVRADALDVVRRDEAGRLSLTLRGRHERLAVSRLNAERVRAI